jgi:hypothetical protein
MEFVAPVRNVLARSTSSWRRCECAREVARHGNVRVHGAGPFGGPARLIARSARAAKNSLWGCWQRSTLAAGGAGPLRWNLGSVRMGMSRSRKLLSAGVVALITAGLGSPAYSQGGPPVHTDFVVPVEESFPSAQPCTGDEGVVTLHESYVVKISTFPDGSAHYNIHGEGTFDFDATNPAAADFIAVPERPTNTQLRVDANGNGTETSVSSYDAMGTDGSRVKVHEVVHFTVVAFNPVSVTLDHFDLHCS